MQTLKDTPLAPVSLTTVNQSPDSAVTDIPAYGHGTALGTEKSVQRVDFMRSVLTAVSQPHKNYYCKAITTTCLRSGPLEVSALSINNSDLGPPRCPAFMGRSTCLQGASETEP